jgi:hypothetical protein
LTSKKWDEVRLGLVHMDKRKYIGTIQLYYYKPSVAVAADWAKFNGGFFFFGPLYILTIYGNPAIISVGKPPTRAMGKGT